MAVARSRAALAIDGREVQYPAKPATVIMDDVKMKTELKR